RRGGQRLHVRGVGELRVGHDRGRVRVHEDHPETLSAEGLAGLGPGIVELAGLADDDGPGANHQDRADVRPPGHQAMSSRNRSNRWPASRGPGAASGWNWTE